MSLILKIIIYLHIVNFFAFSLARYVLENTPLHIFFTSPLNNPKGVLIINSDYLEKENYKEITKISH